MPRKKFFGVNTDPCGGYGTVANPFIPATPTNIANHPIGEYAWDSERECCEFFPLDDICFGFNASHDLDNVVQADANKRCTNEWLNWSSFSWALAHPSYFPSATDPRDAFSTDDYAYYDLTATSFTPTFTQYNNTCKSNYVDSWRVWNGRGEAISGCTLAALLAFNPSADPTHLLHWQQFYHRQILWEGELRTGGLYEAEFNQHGSNAYRASTPSDFPFIAGAPPAWDGQKCVRTFYFAKFTFGMSENISGSHPCGTYSPYSFIVPGMLCDTYLFGEPNSFPVTIDIGCPAELVKMGPSSKKTAYTGPHNDLGIGTTPWNELPWPAPWPDAEWAIQQCVVGGGGTVTSRFYKHRATDAWYEDPDWPHYICTASGGIPLERVEAPDSGNYTCHEAYVDLGCGYGHVLDPTDPLGLRCIPECLASACPDGYEAYSEYPGYPGGEPGFPLPICVRKYEDYITSGQPMGWARGLGNQLFLDGLKVYSDGLPEIMLYQRVGPGVLSRRGSGLIDFWVMEQLQNPPPPADPVTRWSQLRHYYTEDNGATFKPASAHGAYVYEEDLDLPGGAGSWHASLAQEWKNWFTAHPIPSFIGGWRYEFEEEILADRWRVVYDSSGHRYVFAFHHDGAWWCREARQVSPEDPSNWTLSDEHSIATTDDYTMAELSLSPGGLLEFLYYDNVGDGVLLRCSNLNEGQGDWL